MFRSIIKILPSILLMRGKHKEIKSDLSSSKGFWNNLVRDDNNFSTVNFFLVAATIVGISLLIMPMIAMGVDLYYNHTLTINLGDMGTYIIAVAGIFGAAGLTNAWTEYSYQRYNKNIFDNENNQENHTNFGQL